MRQGFSLVELSVVLVIIGLVAGGIVSGQAVMNAASRRSVITEYQKYLAATFAFQEKYNGLPGDLKDATSYFGTAAACPGVKTTPSLTAATCNGDGNRQIYWTSANANEEYRFWQQLAGAGLIDGSYTGVSNSTSYSDFAPLAGWNAPTSKTPTAYWRAFWVGSITLVNTGLIDGDYGNVLMLETGTNPFGVTPVLTSEDMWNIDKKIDDGIAGSGILRSAESTTNCQNMTPSSTVSLQSAEYNLATKNISCTAIFLMTM